VEYEVEQWGEKWDETVGVAKLCNWHCVQGCATYYVSRTLTSQQRVYEQVSPV